MASQEIPLQRRQNGIYDRDGLQQLQEDLQQQEDVQRDIQRIAQEEEESRDRRKMRRLFSTVGCLVCVCVTLPQMNF